jgi:putative RecB family exonuclease
VTGAAALAQLRQERHVSASAITTYLKCPAQHSHRYIRRTEPSHRAGALAFGTAIHAALAVFYQHLMRGEEAPVEEMHDLFADVWRRELQQPVPTLLDEGDTEDGLLCKGLELLAVFHEQVGRPPRVLDIEAPFSLEIADPITGEALEARLVGVFDLVVGDADGQTRVVEHKTAARRWTEDRLTYDLQLSAYSLAARLMGYGDARLTVQVLLKTKKPALELYHPTRTAADHRDLIAVAVGVLKAVDAGIAYPVRDWHCKSCPYAHACVVA